MLIVMSKKATTVEVESVVSIIEKKGYVARPIPGGDVADVEPGIEPALLGSPRRHLDGARRPIDAHHRPTSLRQLQRIGPRTTAEVERSSHGKTFQFPVADKVSDLHLGGVLLISFVPKVSVHLAQPLWCRVAYPTYTFLPM